MRIVRTLHQSRKGVLGTLLGAPLLYAAVVLLAPTPAVAASECELVSCQVDLANCNYESGRVGWCCYTCYEYLCADGTRPLRCRIECGVQC